MKKYLLGRPVSLVFYVSFFRLTSDEKVAKSFTKLHGFS